MKKAFMVVMSLFVLAACSSQSTLADTKGSSPNGKVYGYINSNPTNVSFIQYTDTDGKLKGTYYNKQKSSTNKLLSYTSPLTGDVSGNTITFTITNLGYTYSGNLSNGEINLAFPQKNGPAANIQFKTGTLNDFNAAVSQIQSKNQKPAQQNKQNADLNKQLSDLEKTVNAETESIATDEENLQKDVDNTENDSSSEENDLETVMQEEQQLMKEAPGPQTSLDAASVRSDATAIQSDDAILQSDNLQFQTVIQTLQNELATFQKDFASLNTTASKIRATLPTYLPKKSDGNQIISHEQTVIKRATDAMNGFLSKSKQTINSANSLAYKANQHT